MKKVLFGFQGLLTIILLVQLLLLGMFPLLYISAISCILIILWLLVLLLDIKASKRSNRKDYGAVIMSVLLSIVLLFVNVYANIGTGVLNQITGNSTQIRYYSVVVLADSSINEVSDLSGDYIGIDRSSASENLDILLDYVLENAPYCNIAEYRTNSSSLDALYSNDINALLIDEALRNFYEDEIETFSTDTRVIYSIDVKSEISLSNAVNVTKDPFTVYISGLDTYGAVSTVSRSDVNILLTINPNTNQILMTSLPRDSYVVLDSYNQYDKLTHAGIYGIDESIDTISSWLDIDINYYAKVNFSSLTKIIDAMGGIYVDVGNQSFSNNAVTITSGVNYFDGASALAFCRERYQVSGGDLGRGQNQMLVIEAIINKLISPVIITNYSSILNAISSCLETNMSSGDITKLINMQLSNMNSWSISSYQVSGSDSSSTSTYSMPGQSVYVMVPDAEIVSNAKNNIQDIIDGNTPTYK